VWGNATTAEERQSVLEALARQGRWVTVYYGWRPNLPDEQAGRQFAGKAQMCGKPSIRACSVYENS